MTNHPDFLRSPSSIFDADPRSADFDLLSEQGFRPITLQDHHGPIAEIKLNDGVPQEIIANFETAKNLSLFSWFVYRFHSAARSHTYECLELALSTRFKADLLAQEEEKRKTKYEEEVKRNPRNAKPPQPIDPEKFHPGLRKLLQYAIDVGALRNEDFSVWQLKTKARARSRRDLETIKRMAELGLTEIEIDSTHVEITEQDREHDYLAEVLVPFIRNHYAHGTTALDNKSLSALRLTSEIINQIFPKTDPAMPA